VSITSDRRVIALGNLAGDLKGALEAAVQGAGLELFLTREPARAFVELERDGALAVLVDMATLGAEQFCKRARSAERLRGVPVIGMSRTPNELGFARVYAWGADDLVPLGSRNALERRLKVLATTEKTDATSFGRAVVAEATTQRRALVGRVLAQAGYDVKFAVDRAAVELYASQSETRLVVISAALGDPRRMIDAAAKAGALPTWIVTAEMRSVNRLAGSLVGLDRVAVTSTAGSPEDVLFLANELVFGKGTRRRDWRALYATPVAFRPAGGVVDEYGFSYEASPKGLYVRSLLPPEADDVEVEIRLPARDERVRLTGKIMRRFAFGSGSIASAPPGFGIKLTGPEVSLALWAEACDELIAGASSDGSSSPPRSKQPGVAMMQDSGAPSADVALALPPATLTIESVVAPLPVDDTPANVGDLLAATLDEQTLTEVGTRPVTMDPDTLGVREERPSEYGLHAPAAEASPGAAPLPAAGRPAVAQAGEPERALPLPAPGSSGAPAPSAATDWESDAKTVVRTTEEPPAVTAPPPATSVTPAAGGKPLSLPMPAPRPKEAPADKAQPPRAGFKGTLLMGSSPAMPAVAAPTPAIVPPAGSASDAPPTAVGGAPAPVRSPAAFAGTMLLAPTPDASPAPAAGPAPAAPAAARDAMFGAPEPAPKPADPSVIVEFGTLRTERPPEDPPPAAREPPPRGMEPVPERTPLEAKPIEVTLESTPLELAPAPERAKPKPAEAPAQAAPVNPWERTIAVDSAAASSFRDAGPSAPAAPADEDMAPAGVPSVGPSKVMLLLVGLVALAGGAALVVLFGRKPAPAPEPIEAVAAAASGTSPLEVAAPPPPAPAAPTASARTSASAAPAGSAPPLASAAPEPSATAPAASEAPAPAPAPTGPVSEFDLTKLPAERAALFVRSSAKARVFVHGAEYGDTNTWLITSCGIRFVRLGHKLGDFIEPGRSYVVKCGKATELGIEPIQ
jgi:DNA-binding response OmpR family regulator